MKRIVILLLAAFAVALVFGLSGCAEDGDDGDKGEQGEQGPPGEPGPPAGDPTTSVETCVGCHGEDAVRPVGNLEDPMDVHGMEISPLETLVINITEVDVTDIRVDIEFEAETEMGAPVSTLLASDGRFTIARLDEGMNGDPTVWVPLITDEEDPDGVGPGTMPLPQADYERFASARFTNNLDGSYSYSSSFNPQDVPIEDGDTIRVAIQIDEDDSPEDPDEHIPTGNGWCDFDADLSSPNDCVSGTSLTRDIVQTDTCNGCHGVTSDVRLALHGGNRIAVEYCVTCHNPTTFDANSGNSVDFPVLIHKIHYGAELEDGYMIYGFRDNLHDYSHVEFTKDIDDCTNCHTGVGADVDNWSMVPSIEACTACHDDLDITSPTTTHGGNQQTTNAFCVNCHPQSGPITAGLFPVETVHRGVARRMEAARYEYVIDNVTFDSSSDEVTVDYRVNQDGGPMDLLADPEWSGPPCPDPPAVPMPTCLEGGAARLAVTLGWKPGDDYTNEGASAPASPISIDALANAVVRGPSLYSVTGELPREASGTVTASLEGHPAADLDGDGRYGDRIAVKNVFENISIEGGRSMADPRRVVVDVENCNQCHDAAGQGISLHGNNRTGETQVCVVCHNGNNTDIARRPDDPMDALDGKKEEAIDFGRMIHQIHSGAELEEGVVIYGFGFPRGTAHDFGHVEFIGNRRNCETCHVPADSGDPLVSERNYGTVAASKRLPTTIDTGPTSTPTARDGDPDDDLNISPTAAICSSCHDSEPAKDHMKLHGASFEALDDDIL